jgi:hypothetical protein
MENEQTNTPEQTNELGKEIVPRGYIGSEERLMEAMKKNRGIMAFAAVSLGVTRQAVWDYIHRRPHLKPLIEDIRQTSVDRTEAKLFKLIDGGDVRAVIFHLKTQGKDRGYVERTEMVGENGGPIQIMPVMPVKMIDKELEQIDPSLLTREEQKELTLLVNEVDEVGGAFTALPEPKRTQFIALVDKGRPKRIGAPE